MYDFGLSSEQFWDLTAPQFAALADRHDERNQRDEFYSGNVCAVLANIHRDDKKKPTPFTAKDFMPSMQEDEVAPSGEMTPDQILTYLQAAFPPIKVKEEHGG